MTDLFERLRTAGTPLAAPAAQVLSGTSRFTVLTPRLIRLEWSPDGRFEDRASYAFPNRRARVPRFERAERDGTVVIDTGELTLRHRPDGAPFSADNLRIDLTGRVRGVWRPGDPNPGNLGGARRTVDDCRGEAALEPGLCSRDGWSLIDDSAGFVFDEDGWPCERREGQRLDWYFFGYGHDYAAAVADYTEFGAAVPLVPRWLLGAWWSRYHDYSENELKGLVEEFRRRDFPLDVLVIDMDWHKPDSWTGYSWNRSLFPDPPGFLAWLHERHLHVTLNLHPALGVQPFEDAYEQFARAVGVSDASAIPFEITQRTFVKPYLEMLHHPLEADGVDFWWMDWQQGRQSPVRGLDPLPWLNHLHFQDMTRHPDRRPVVFSRWGGLGSHRYPIGFSGDAWAQWSALAFQPRYTAAGANVAYGWWSHDIGGHHGADDPELYVRWVQFGAVSPVLRLHSNNRPESERRPWAFGADVERLAREAFRMRYQLLPYLYTAARTAADTGVSLVRPTSWAAPEHDGAYAARDQYLLGPDLLVAPVIRPRLPGADVAEVDVWLPPGDWVERTTGERASGPRWLRIGATLGHVPQFVRPGTILPLAPVAGTTTDQPADHLLLSVFPGAAGGTRVYEDDGTSPDYRDGAHSWTAISCEPTPDGLSVVIAPVEGRAPTAQRRFTVRVEHVSRPSGARIDGRPAEVGYEDGRAVVEIPTGPREQPVHLEVAGARPLDRTDEARAADLERLPDTAECRPLAVARAGGPTVRVVEHTAPDEAARTLGTVVIGAPERAEATARIHWVLERPDGPLEFDDDPRPVPAEGLVVAAPFAWDGTLTPARWHARVEVGWEQRTLTSEFAGRPLIPAVPSWWIASELEDVRRWARRSIDPEDLDFPNLAQQAVFRLGPPWQPPSGRAMTAYCRTTLTAVETCEVALEYRSGGEVSLSLDGRPVEADVTGAPRPPLFTLHPQPRRTPPVRLTAGPHELEVRCHKPAELPELDWYLSLCVVDPADHRPALRVVAGAGDEPGPRD